MHRLDLGLIGKHFQSNMSWCKNNGIVTSICFCCEILFTDYFASKHWHTAEESFDPLPDSGHEWTRTTRRDHALITPVADGKQSILLAVVT